MEVRMNARQILPLAISAALIPGIALSQVSNATAHANVAAAAHAIATLDKQAAKIDAAARGKADANVATRIATGFVPMAGTPERAQALVRGLHTGAAVRLGAHADVTLGARARLSWGHTAVSLALARELLGLHGIRNPDAADLRAVLLGGQLKLLDGSLVPVRGIVQLHGLGMSWERIAALLGIDVGQLLAALQATEQRVSESPVRQASASSNDSSTSNTSNTTNTTSNSTSNGNTNGGSASGGSTSTGSTNGGSSGNGSARANDTVLTRQAALIDDLAKSDPAGTLSSLSNELASFAGSKDAASALLTALGDGSGSLVKTAAADSPAQGRPGGLGLGGAFLALAFARDLLAQNAIKSPDALQLRAVLVGGWLKRANGMDVPAHGIVRLRLHGISWGDIAQLYGIRLGRIAIAVRGSTLALGGIDARVGAARDALGVGNANAVLATIDRSGVQVGGASQTLVAQRLGINSIEAVPAGATLASTAGSVTGNIAAGTVAPLGNTAASIGASAGGIASGTIAPVTGSLGGSSGPLAGAGGVVGAAGGVVGSATGALGLGNRGR